MKKTKVIPQILVASTLLLGTACSTTNTGTGAGTTSGSSTSTDASGSSGATGSGTVNSNSAATNAAGSPSTGAIGSGAGAGTSSTGFTGTAGTAGATGADAAADPTAFMATFATMQDPVFLMNAASSNMLEIQAGQMAAQRATNPDVKKFAQMMVDHHTKATQQLKTVATPLSVQMPQTLMPVHQAMLDRLAAKSGKDFDEEYMDLMEAAHKMDIAMFEVKGKRADVPAVQSFATQTLPMLRSHGTMAGEVEKKVD
ncbi:DUF4142 domain-containing protein [Hymenobacter weizhouensis]|uniref:DUF4142 domain-containing protein n=1 Tax=Hymenobacter sp. YIM 151500-1 TaxID=2987689 RepID=UPI002226D71C|nr:DUF4142 domain-containing protein [Hymenobacter sp. YIM 151500-1]UYZ61445.1 DUF4142 domain-containing protein [Hymenobacter sp. YIM 151500-1]